MARSFAGRRYWIVGASEGLGRALAAELARAGAALVLSARDETRLRDLADSLPGGADCVACDIGDAASVRAAAGQVGAVDGVVILAGVYWPVDARAWEADKVTAMCDINFTGAARVLGHVVPDMVARGAGHVVLTGSLSGFRGLPGAIGYGASKAAVMALAETMRCDLRSSGVTVQLVNPGFIRTRMTEKNDFPMPFIMDPEPAARRMMAHLRTDRFACNFPTGFSLVFRLGQFLPDWLYYRIWGA